MLLTGKLCLQWRCAVQCSSEAGCGLAAGGHAVQSVQGAAVIPQQGYGTLQPQPTGLLLVPGGPGLEGGQLW